MKITIGSMNAIKTAALEETIKEYEFLAGATIEPRNVDSLVSKQPISLAEIIAGAINRAQQAYENCDYSFGIESGFMPAPHTNTGYMELSICAAYDGKNIALGFSPAFECPQDIMNEILSGKDIEEACITTGLTSNSQIGRAEGILGILTKGRMTRKDYTKQAIKMALLQFENRHLY